MKRALLLPLAVLLAAAIAAARPPASADKAPVATGTIARVTASQRSVEVTLSDGSSEQFFWNADTKISGTLTPGAGVTVRYAPGADGKKLALQITVARS